MIMEYAARGDLLTYLRGRRHGNKSEPETGEVRATATRPSPSGEAIPTAKELFAFSLQVARGMRHLADNNVSRSSHLLQT